MTKSTFEADVVIFAVSTVWAIDGHGVLSYPTVIMWRTYHISRARNEHQQFL